MPATCVQFRVLERLARVLFAGPLADDLATAALDLFGDLEAAASRQHDGAPDLVLDTAGQTLPLLLEQLSQRLCLWGIEQRRSELLMLHACSVADESGRAVGFVGPSGMGKSTLARTLGAHWAYLGDEVLALRDDNGIVPLPKPLSLIAAPGQPKAQVPAQRLGLMDLGEGAAPRLSALVVLDRRDGAATALSRIATIDALAMLAAQTSYLGSHPRPLHRLARAIELAGGCRRLSYAESADVVEVARELLAG